MPLCRDLPCPKGALFLFYLFVFPSSLFLASGFLFQPGCLPFSLPTSPRCQATRCTAQLIGSSSWSEPWKYGGPPMHSGPIELCGLERRAGRGGVKVCRAGHMPAQGGQAAGSPVLHQTPLSAGWVSLCPALWLHCRVTHTVQPLPTWSAPLPPLKLRPLGLSQTKGPRS